MHTKIFSATTIGVDAHCVEVEVDLSFGMINFFIVGLCKIDIKISYVSRFDVPFSSSSNAELTPLFENVPLDNEMIALILQLSKICLRIESLEKLCLNKNPCGTIIENLAPILNLEINVLKK